MASNSRVPSTNDPRSLCVADLKPQGVERVEAKPRLKMDCPRRACLKGRLKARGHDNLAQNIQRSLPRPNATLK